MGSRSRKKRKLRADNDNSGLLETSTISVTNPDLTPQQNATPCFATENKNEIVLRSIRRPTFVTHLYDSQQQRKLKLTLLKSHLRLFSERMNLISFVEVKFTCNKIKIKMGAPYGKHKFFQGMDKSCKALTKLDSLGICKLCMELHDSMVLGFDDSVNCPSKEQFTHFMAKIVTACELLVIIVDYCHMTAFYCTQYLQMQHFVPNCMVVIGLMGELRGKVVELLKIITELYSTIIPFINRIQKVSQEQDSLQFPENLITSFPDIQRILNDTKIVASPQQKDSYMQFLESLFGEFTWKESFKPNLVLKAERSKVEKEIKKMQPNSLDLGIAVKYKVLEGILALLRDVENIPNMKKVFRSVKSEMNILEKRMEKSEKPSFEDRMQHKVLIECKLKFKSRWSPILAVKSGFEPGRLKSEIVELRQNLIKMLSI